MGKQWKQWQIFFLGSKITADGDFNHEIKRCLLLGRKPMTNLDSILKSRDITLLTKAHIIKAMVFPVVMYGYESWMIKEAEHWRIDAFELWCWRRLLSPSDSKEIKSVNPKGIQPWIFIERTDAEAEAPILGPSDVKSWLIGKDPDAGKDWGQEKKEATQDYMVESHHWLNGYGVKYKCSCSGPLRPHGPYSPWNSPDQNTEVCCHFHPQGIFPIQGLNPDLLHFSLILNQLSHQGSSNGHKLEQTQGDIEGQGNLSCCSPWGHKELDMTEQLNNNNKNSKLSLHPFPVPSLATTLLIFFLNKIEQQQLGICNVLSSKLRISGMTKMYAKEIKEIQCTLCLS